jgi:two-component system, NarL family, nitrate/nitrite sensor histidine kinase NarX
MWKLSRKSLLLRLGAAMALILMLAVLGMASSMVLAQMMRGDAAAVNQAGSLRYQTYRIGTRLAASREDLARYEQELLHTVEGFEARLTSPRLTGAIPQDPTSPLRITYDWIAEGWAQRLQPAVFAAASVDRAPFSDHALLALLDEFYEQSNRLVMLLEVEAEKKVRVLRAFDAIMLLLTIVAVYFTMRQMRDGFLLPLRGLLEFAERARRGDFSARVGKTDDDELGQLGNAFNIMAADLSRSYAELKSRVHETTIDLERSNRSLELLYNTMARLSEGATGEATCSALLEDIERVVGIGSGIICLGESGGGRVFELTSAGARRSWKACDVPACDACEADIERCLLALGIRERDHALAVPLRDQEHNYGVLLVHMPEGTALAPWQRQLLIAVGRHVGFAIGTTRRAVQSRRLALLEERAVIARELHDSLAQSLSYLKIQVSRLQALLAQGTSAEITEVVTELREGLSGAYRQLRELLTTFRLQADGRGLGPALADTVEEFSTRRDMPIELEIGMAGCPLSVNEEMHILQIVREALANVVHHAQAQHVWIALHVTPGRGVNVTVEDDGLGIRPAAGGLHHYGLAIMQERAHSLGGELRVTPRADGGTRVTLEFVPLSQRATPLTTTTGGPAPA